MFNKYILSPLLSTLSVCRSKNAFCINEKFYTYEDFVINISKVRSKLQEHSYSSKYIGLVANDDIETYASIFAIWFEGLSYVPIQPKHPQKRNMEILENAGIDLLIDSSSNSVYPVAYTIRSKHILFKGLNLIPNRVKDSEIAYILFTSGSTGKPKGVPVTRGNLGAFVKAFWDVGFDIDKNDRFLQAFDLTFDVSIQCFLIPLLKGAGIYTIPNDQIKYSYASALLEEQKLTFCVMAPSMVRFLRPYFNEINLPDLRYCILTAEASQLKLVEEWSVCIPNAEIFNFYGPTEATIYCTYSRFHRNSYNKQLNGMLSIGKPLNKIKAIIIDDEKNLLPIEQKGELCVSGNQVTQGYWKNPEKNKASFFEKELGGLIHRFYKTGDLCYFDNEGDIMYSGRIDHQVKIQGYRIELGEIEHYAREYLNGQHVVAIAYENTSGNYEIALFIEGYFRDTQKTIEYLKLKLPYYMIPSKVIQIDLLPLNKNDKVDRNALINNYIY